MKILQFLSLSFVILDIFVRFSRILGGKDGNFNDIGCEEVNSLWERVGFRVLYGLRYLQNLQTIPWESIYLLSLNILSYKCVHFLKLNSQFNHAFGNMLVLSLHELELSFPLLIKKKKKNENAGRNLHSSPEESTPQYEKSFFKSGEMTPRFLRTLVGLLHHMLMNCLAAGSASMSKALK